MISSFAVKFSVYIFNLHIEAGVLHKFFPIVFSLVSGAFRLFKLVKTIIFFYLQRYIYIYSVLIFFQYSFFCLVLTLFDLL